jgi:hypothetical protein
MNQVGYRVVIELGRRYAVRPYTVLDGRAGNNKLLRSPGIDSKESIRQPT